LPQPGFYPAFPSKQVIIVGRNYVNLKIVLIAFKEQVWFKQSTPLGFIELYLLDLGNKREPKKRDKKIYTTKEKFTSQHQEK
jgi:hypothetical protein